MGNEYEQEYLDRGTDRLGLQVYPDPDGPGGPEAPVVLVWPAMGVPARYYRPLARELRVVGLGVVVVDLRGNGTSTPVPSRRSRYGYGDLASDVEAVLDTLKPRLDGRRVLLLGHSLGGQACVLHLAINGAAGVDGLVLVAVGLPWFRSYGSPWRSLTVLGFTQWIQAMSELLGVWPGWGFGGRQSARLIRDWGYTARHGRFPRIDGTEVEAAVAGIRTPVLAISIDNDRYTPPSTVDHLCAKMGFAQVERVHVTAADAGTPIDHFGWVRASAPVAARVAAMAGRV